MARFTYKMLLEHIKEALEGCRSEAVRWSAYAETPFEQGFSRGILTSYENSLKIIAGLEKQKERR